MMMNVTLDKICDKMMSWCWTLLRRRLAPGDSLFEDGDIYCKLASKYLPGDVREGENVKRLQEFPCGIANCSHVFNTLAKYESHYNTVHRNVCQTCHKIFPSSHLLEIHILETHDVMFTLLAQKQDMDVVMSCKMYMCLVESCSEKFHASHDRRNHMIRVHKYPPNYRYDHSKHKQRQTKKSKSNQGDVVSMETEHSQQPESRETDVPATGRVFSYKVPKNICFGQGVARGFQRGRGRGRGGKHKKHWHNKSSDGQDTAVSIENIDMKDLSEALT